MESTASNGHMHSKLGREEKLLLRTAMVTDLNYILRHFKSRYTVHYDYAPIVSWTIQGYCMYGWDPHQHSFQEQLQASIVGFQSVNFVS